MTVGFSHLVPERSLFTISYSSTYEESGSMWRSSCLITFTILTMIASDNFDDRAVSRVMKSIKGVSARNINRLLKRSGFVRRDESFDHIVRATERSRAKFECVCNNPVRTGLVKSAYEYPWLWRSWIEGAQTGVSAPHSR